MDNEEIVRTALKHLEKTGEEIVLGIISGRIIPAQLTKIDLDILGLPEDADDTTIRLEVESLIKDMMLSWRRSND